MKLYIITEFQYPLADRRACGSEFRYAYTYRYVSVSSCGS